MRGPSLFDPAGERSLETGIVAQIHVAVAVKIECLAAISQRPAAGPGHALVERGMVVEIHIIVTVSVTGEPTVHRSALCGQPLRTPRDVVAIVGGQIRASVVRFTASLSRA